MQVNTKKLKEWCGNPPPDASFSSEDMVEGALFGKVFNLRRLATLLAPIPFQTLILWDTSGVTGVRSLGISAKGKWRAILAATDGEPDVDSLVFDDRPEGAAAFDMMAQLTED